MKYKIACICLYIFYNATLFCLDDYTNQIFMFTRPISNSISINQAAWNNYAYEKHSHGSGFQMYLMYEQSIEKEISPEYFLFDHKRKLRIQGGTNPTEFELTSKGYIPKNPLQDQITTPSFKRDILGQWLNYNDSNELSFTLNPFQRQACGMLEFNQDLKKLIESDFVNSWYIAIRIPITYVANDIGFTGDQAALEAFGNNNFNYANITACKLTDTRPTNLHFIFGTKYLHENDSQIISSMGVIVPLVEQNSNRFLFEPIQGFNAHFAFLSQILFQFPLISRDDNASSRVCFFLALENVFLARNKQMRTFDLQDKPYSRYMKLLDIHSNSIVPAVNVLTLRSRVEPFNIFNGASGIRVKFHDHEGEFGYELWAHGTEVVTVENKFEAEWQDNRYGIAFINEDGVLASINPTTNKIQALPEGENGQTASKSTINYIASPDGYNECCPNPTFVQKNKYISLDDLDLFSAASRSTVVHRAYASITVGQRGKTRDFFINLGAYIEEVQNNAALSMWGGWIKIGLTF